MKLTNNMSKKNKNKVYETMRKDLTHSDVKELFDYDDENGWLIRKKDRYGRPCNRPTGNKPNPTDGYGRINLNGVTYFTHRIIWLLCKGVWPKFEINHIDGNRMNNRIENLEDVDHKQNMASKGGYKNNKTGYPGVSWWKDRKKYHSQIQSGGAKIHLGDYLTPEEAFLAYQFAKIKYHPTSQDAKKYAEELGIIIHE